MRTPSSIRSSSIVRVGCALAALCATAAPAAAQFLGGQAVGGISVDADGIVRTLEPAAVDSLARERSRALSDSGWRGAAGDARKVSLKAVVAAVRETRRGTPLAVEVQLLGGLERVEHVFVDPEGHDVILAGPADAIVVDPAGNLLGARTGRPPLQLEDLVVALRAIDGVRQGGITCSIDPSREGLARLREFLGRQSGVGPDPRSTFAGMEEALGPQTVTVGGVPGDSRIARVLVAADYRMKRIGMGLEPSGVDGLPSYLALLPAGGRSATLPRFWLEADYEPLSRDADELAWRIGGRRMRCLTESDREGEAGIERGAGQTDATARRWCEAMTTHYEPLAAKQPVFAELVNCIDLAVVAALIRGRQLDARAGLDLGPLCDPETLPLPVYEVPAKVPTVASGLEKGGRWVLSASGGISVQPWAVAADVEDDADIAAARVAAIAGRPADVAGCCWD